MKKPETSYVDLDPMLERVPTKFALVNVTVKRAAQLAAGAAPLSDRARPDKTVSTAFAEIADGKIGFKPGRDS